MQRYLEILPLFLRFVFFFILQAVGLGQCAFAFAKFSKIFFSGVDFFRFFFFAAPARAVGGFFNFFDIFGAMRL